MWGLHRKQAGMQGIAHAQAIRALSFDTDYRAFELPSSRPINLDGLPANVCSSSMFSHQRQGELRMSR